MRVLRMQRGEQILVTDGLGHLFHCEITNPHQKHCEVRILSTEEPEALHEGYVHIAIAPTKNIDRLEWMIEKCTEMGVDELTPLLCEHSERKNVNEDRLRKIMVSAAKQSLKTTFPRLNPLTRFADFVEQAQSDDLLIAHCMSDDDDSDNTLQRNYQATSAKTALKDNITRGHSVVILIGPEGDFSEKEVELALGHGCRPVSLGKARLRTETAGLVACHTALLQNS